MHRSSKWWFGLAAGIVALTIVAPAIAAETSAAHVCVIAPLDGAPAPEGTPSLSALQPTLRIVAEDYDKKASVYTEQAERFRTWASAEEMFDGTTYGKRYAAIYFADEASELEKEAAESRRLAAKYRKLAESRDASNGC